MIELLKAAVSAVGLWIVVWWLIGGPKWILRNDSGENQ